MGHQAWTAAEANLADASDDALTVYASDREAALITHDVEFSKRRKHSVVGRHIWLSCKEWEAADLLAKHLDEILPILRAYNDLWIRISASGWGTSQDWG